jgi:hypothetical protein
LFSISVKSWLLLDDRSYIACRHPSFELLDVPADKAKGAGGKELLGEGGPGVRSMSENPGKEEKGTWGLRRGE